MAWNSVPHTMLQLVAVWAVLNLSAITLLATLFLVENAWSAVLRRRHPRGGAPVIPISGH